MDDRLAVRIAHLKEAIGLSRQLLEGSALEDVRGDRFTRAAFERFLEIVSEASRHIPRRGRPNIRKFPGGASGISGTSSATPMTASTSRSCGGYTKLI